MSKKIVVWGTDEVTVANIMKSFREKGDCVYPCIGTSQEMIHTIFHEEYIDILVLCPSAKALGDKEVGIKHDYKTLNQTIEKNVIDLREVFDIFVPLLRKSETKRIALLTSEKSSVRLNQETTDYAWHMSLAAINMMMTIKFHILRPEGFTFRVFCIDDESVINAYQYINAGFSYHEIWQPIRSEENRIVMRNTRFEEITW